ncbi:hypothetical protein GCM10023329_28240 [Streptomyces sanyensis]|uniref:Uncharacterized protein n=1 Tax=Streptomyces sanyensis TaxID=568869 RepID=A0ABP9AAD2_9ACTN
MAATVCGRCAEIDATDGWGCWTGTSAGCWLMDPFFRVKRVTGASERAGARAFLPSGESGTAGCIGRGSQECLNAR